MSNVGEHHFGMVMRTDFLMKFFFFYGGSLERVTGSKNGGGVGRNGCGGG